MLNGALARRYAQALFELAVEASALDKIDAELREISRMIESCPDLKYLLNHPNVDADEKKDVMEKIFGEEVSLLAKHFFYLLLDRRRQNLTALIQREFSALADEKNQIIEAKVTSAMKLTDDQTKELKQAIGRMTKRNVRLHSSVNPALIGGAKIKIGDRVMDGSIAASLEKMKQELKKSSVY